jgi:hypothetical protein
LVFRSNNHYSTTKRTNVEEGEEEGLWYQWIRGKDTNVTYISMTIEPNGNGRDGGRSREGDEKDESDMKGEVEVRHLMRSSPSPYSPSMVSNETTLVVRVPSFSFLASFLFRFSPHSLIGF